MDMGERISGYRVRFVCRYRNVNTYAIDSRTTSDIRAEVRDDGSMYRPCEMGDSLALELVREYETRAWLAHLDWCNRNGHVANDEHRHALVPA